MLSLFRGGSGVLIIRSCHVENFGKLHQADFAFYDGLQVIRAGNGAGKSTLASFICVMFYGFDGERLRDDLRNERRRFAPWQGGVYGGSVTFTLAGQNWRIERTFGEKNNRTDTLDVFDADTNLRTERFGEVPGEVIFSVDRPSFERTVFIGQLNCMTEATPGISAKIGRVTEDAADMSRYEEAQRQLKAETDRLTPHRKTGLIARMDAEISSLSAEAAGKENCEKALDRSEDALHRLRNRASALSAEQKRTVDEMDRRSASQDRRAVLLQDQTLREAEEEAAGRVRTQREKFPAGLPETEAIEKYLRMAAADGTGRDDLRFLSGEEQERFRSEQQMFDSWMPAADETAEIIRCWDDCRQRKNRINSLQEKSDGIRRFLRDTSGGSLPEPEADEAAEYTREPAANEADEYTREPAADEADKYNREQEIRWGANKKGMHKRAVMMLIIGLIMLISGLAVRFSADAAFSAWLTGFGLPAGVLHTVWTAAGALLLVVGILCAVFSGRRFDDHEDGRRDNREDGRENSRRNNREDGRSDNREARCRRNNGIGITGLENPSVAVMKESWRQLAREIQRETSLMEEGEERVSDYFSRLNVCVSEDEVMEELYRIREAAVDYQRLEARLQQARQRAQGTEAEIRDFLLSSGFTPEDDPESQLMHLLDERKKLDMLVSVWQTGREARKKFERAHPDIFFEEELFGKEADDGSMEALSARFRSLKNEWEEVQRQIRDAEKELAERQAALDHIRSCEEKLSELQAERARAMHRYEVMTRTREMLETARVHFSARYMDPLKRSFDRYYAMFAPGDDKIYEMDADLNISVRESGALRNTAFLSEGYQDMIGLCRRMAMADAMYPEEKPFLVMDDPFVSLDDRKYNGAMRFLEQVGQEYQILYFTCHKRQVEGAD